VRIHTLAHIEGPKGADSGPEAVGSLGHQHQDLSLHLDHEIAFGLRVNPVQEFARVFHPRNVHRGLLRRSPGETTLSTWAVVEVVRPTWLCRCGGVIAQVFASSGAHRDVLLPSGGLGHKGSSAGRLLVLPSFTLLGGPFFSGERCRGSTPVVAPLTGRPATTPAYAAPASA
jgi:hypothetical protein